MDNLRIRHGRTTPEIEGSEVEAVIEEMSKHSGQPMPVLRVPPSQDLVYFLAYAKTADGMTRLGGVISCRVRASGAGAR